MKSITLIAIISFGFAAAASFDSPPRADSGRSVPVVNELPEGYIVPQPGELRPFRIIALDGEEKFTFDVRGFSSQCTDKLARGTSFTYDENDGLSFAFKKVLGLYLDPSGKLVMESKRHLANVKAFIESFKDSFFIILKKKGDGGDQFLKISRDTWGKEILVSTDRLEEAQEFRAEFVHYAGFHWPAENTQFCLAQDVHVFDSFSYIPEPKRSGLDWGSDWILADGCLRPVASPNLVLTAVKKDGTWRPEFQDRKVSTEDDYLIPEQQFELDVSSQLTGFIKIRLEGKPHFLYSDHGILKLSGDSEKSNDLFKILNLKAISNDLFRAFQAENL